ncbi:hypothetical protein H4Q26_007848 [Puccinia striiformis f. sp. tritici PST-130]|nr:hypothetical protein H4Q26_007848 [Puccinia striiformis f. sp. tritici PST-130]
MQQEGPLDLVARIVSSFRSNNADGKSPEEYQGGSVVKLLMIHHIFPNPLCLPLLRNFQTHHRSLAWTSKLCEMLGDVRCTRTAR